MTALAVGCGPAAERPAPAADDIAATAAPVDGLVVREAWISQPPPSADRAAAYLSIDNPGAEAVILTGAATEAAAAVELHEMSHEEGMMRMRRVEERVVAGGETLELQRGGAHLMLIGLRRPLSAGQSVSLTLEFEAGSRVIEVPVRREETASDG